MEKERLQREHRERQERERQERERQREKQLSAVEAVDHHFQLSMELAKKVSPLAPKFFDITIRKTFYDFSIAPPLIKGQKISFLITYPGSVDLYLVKSSNL